MKNRLSALSPTLILSRKFQYPKKIIRVGYVQTVSNKRSKPWSHFLGPKPGFFVLGLRFWLPNPGSCVLDPKSVVLAKRLQVSGPWS